MNKTTSFICIICLVFSETIIAQTEKRLRRDNLTVKVEIRVNALPNDYFYYHYLFSNSHTSHQSMTSLYIEFSDKQLKQGGTVQNITPPIEKNWGKYPIIGRTMDWITYYDTTGKDFLERPPMSVILPGEHLSFSFECKGLPSIGTYGVWGWAPWFFTSEEKDSLLEEGYPESDLTETEENALRGLTIIPRIIVAPVKAFDFIDTIASYKHRSLALGWIKDKRIEQRLDRKLDRAKRLLQMAESSLPESSSLVDETAKELKDDNDECSREYGQDVVREVPHPALDEEKLGQLMQLRHEPEQRSGKNKKDNFDENKGHDRRRTPLIWAAKQVLESFVREVEILNRLSEKGNRQFMTSEAYALLKYNAEYLIGKMPEKKEK